MTLPLNLRASPSGPLIDIIDPDLEAAGRVVYVNNRSTQDLDLQTGSPIAPYSRLATAIFALALTGGTIVIAPGDYTAEVLPALGSQSFTFTNVDPHPNYTVGGIGFNQVQLPAISGSGGLNLIGCQALGTITLSNRLTVDSCWMQAAIVVTALDGFDTRFTSTSSIAMTAGMTLTDCELDAQAITSTAAPLCRLVDCVLATSFSYTTIPTGTLRLDARTASAFGSIAITTTNVNVIFETAATGSGQQILNTTATGALGVVDISTLGPGGSYVIQPTGNFNIDGFTAKQNGFWFDLVYDNTSSVFLGTLNYDVGAATTSMRTPQTVAYQFTRNTTLRMRYQFNRWRVEVPGSAFGNVSPIIINTAINRAIPFMAYRSFAAGGGGAADDVTIVDVGNLGFPIRVVDAWLNTLTPVVGSTCHVRTATGGGGTGLTSLMSSAAAGVTRNNDSTTRNAVAADGLILRRSDSGVAGDISMMLLRTG